MEDSATNLYPQKGGNNMQKETKEFTAEVKEYDETDLTVVHFISTETRDRGGDIMRVDGMRIRGRPVVLMAHGMSKYGQEPIAKPIWIRKGEFKDKRGILAKTQFFPDEDGTRLWMKATQGYMPNWSIGFIVLKWEDHKDGKGGRDITEWELLEYSPVGVPMNPEAQTLEKTQANIWFKFAKPDETLSDEYKSLEAIEEEEKEKKYGELIDMDEKPYPNEHACRIEDPDQYIRLRRQADKFGEGIHAVWGIKGGGKPVELQSIRFSKEKFTADEAKKWLHDHKYKCKLFEPASEKCKICDCENDHQENVATESKGVIHYKKTPLAPEDTPWDGNAEVRKADVKDLKTMCVWYDSENPDTKSSYKGPHHKAEGDHACVWNGVRALSAVIMGARGGMKVPEEDMRGIKRHVEKHYDDFEKGDPPWKKEKGIEFLELAKGLKDPHEIYGRALDLIPDLAEFFKPETDIDRITELESRLEAKIEPLVKAVRELEKTLSALPIAKAEVQDQNPSVGETIVVITESDRQTPTVTVDVEEMQKTISETIKNVLRTMLSKLTGKIT